jgi:hypothetical protein
MRITVNTRSRSAGLVRLALLTAATLLAGCATRDDAAFNPYAPGNGDPTLLEHAEQAVDRVGEALDNLDARLENTVY